MLGLYNLQSRIAHSKRFKKISVDRVLLVV